MKLIYLTLFLLGHFGKNYAYPTDPDPDEIVKYDNYKVFRFFPESSEHLEILSKLQDHHSELNFWKDVSSIGQPVDVLFPPQLSPENFTDSINYETYISNVQDLIDQEETTSRQSTGNLNWNEYFGVEIIYKYLEEMSKKYPTQTQIINIGKSTEGRSLKVMKISKNPEVKKPAIWIDANIHAREWITNTVATYTINELLTNEADPAIKQLSEDYDFYIMPLFNPDGYEFSRARNRLWRKTRSRQNSGLLGALCIGTDANRNWDYKWRTGGSSNVACAETYAGKSAFSEPETQAVSNFYKTIAGDAVAFLSIHSYGQLILFPHGYTRTRHPRFNQYSQISQAMAQAIKSRHGQIYRVGSVSEILYIASGSSIDWVDGTLGTKLAITYEMRDTGRSGFILPANQIIPTGQEFMSSLVEMSKQIKLHKLVA